MIVGSFGSFLVPIAITGLLMLALFCHAFLADVTTFPCQACERRRKDDAVKAKQKAVEAAQQKEARLDALLAKLTKWEEAQADSSLP